MHQTALSRLTDYLALTKPRIGIMALFTVAVGYVLGAGFATNGRVLTHVLVGAGLVAAGGSALNQLIERRLDARMRRTSNRPLPTGRISPEEAAVFGAVLSGAGLAYLAATVPMAATIAAALTFLIYVFIYTPLKTFTVWNTLVGAIPGALPPVIGWCAATGWNNPNGALALFTILFLWQLPHFLAIAWMYREDYAVAGLRMLPITDPTGRRTATTMFLTAAALLLGSLLSVAVGLGSWLYGIGAVLLGLWFLHQTYAFTEQPTDRKARTVLRASLVYLPAVLVLLLIDGYLNH
jgi:protoheme IX farnesyltransferase